MKRSATDGSSQILKSSRQCAKFLLKSEPDLPIQSFLDLPDQTGQWTGIRNYQARNIQREMKSGDLAFFYHSNIKKNNGIYGIVEVVNQAYDDTLMYDATSKYYDTKAKPGKWLTVDIKLVEIWEKPILLSTLKEEISKCNGSESPLSLMMLFKMSRLSTQRVSQLEWDHIIDMHLK